ncbi:MAG: PH domain-containing protein [Candidatus Micrarchaeota archaeon]|nr:PH domain-containing protein [Candidatus Micrarchaeota archaeon]
MDIKKYHLSPKVKLLWAGKFLFAIILLLVVIYATAYFVLSMDIDILGSLLLIVGGLLLILLAAYLGYIQLKYDNFRYAFGDKEFILEEGIVIKKFQRIPYEKIQNVSIIYPIPHRILNVGKVIITTAATDIKLSEFVLEALDRPHDFSTQLLYRVEKRDEEIGHKRTRRRRKVKKTSEE